MFTASGLAGQRTFTGKFMIRTECSAAADARPASAAFSVVAVTELYIAIAAQGIFKCHGSSSHEQRQQTFRIAWIL